MKNKIIAIAAMIILYFEMGMAQNPYMTLGPGYIDLNISAGIQGGSFNDQAITGYPIQGRLTFNLLDITPTIFIGVNYSYNPLSLDDDGVVTYPSEQSVDGNFKNTSLGIMGGLVLPSRIIFNKRGVPPGSGIPMYFGYNFIDDYKLTERDNSTLEGKGYFIGGTMYIFNKSSWRLGFNVEFRKSTFKDTNREDIPVFYSELDLENLMRSGMQYSLQINIPLMSKKYGDTPANFYIE